MAKGEKEPVIGLSLGCFGLRRNDGVNRLLERLGISARIEFYSCTEDAGIGIVWHQRECAVQHRLGLLVSTHVIIGQTVLLEEEEHRPWGER